MEKKFALCYKTIIKLIRYVPTTNSASRYLRKTFSHVYQETVHECSFLVVLKAKKYIYPTYYKNEPVEWSNYMRLKTGWYCFFIMLTNKSKHYVIRDICMKTKGKKAKEWLIQGSTYLLGRRVGWGLRKNTNVEWILPEMF